MVGESVKKRSREERQKEITFENRIRLAQGGKKNHKEMRLGVIEKRERVCVRESVYV